MVKKQIAPLIFIIGCFIFNISLNAVEKRGNSYWECIGFDTAMVNIIEIAPSQPNTIYIVINYDDIYKTTTALSSPDNIIWDKISDFEAFFYLPDIEIASHNPDVVYAYGHG